MDPIIKLQELSKRYGSQKAVNKLSLEINRGEIFGLLGPNGAGKTTSILMMLGLTEPDSGSATVCGYDATRNPILIKRKVGYMPDHLGFYPQMTGMENLRYIARLNGLGEASINQRTSTVLELVGLKDAANKKTSAYSRGMKQRLGLADVLIKSPEVIILDEPTLGIDPAGVKEFLELIKRLSAQQGLTVLLSSHHLHHVQQVCDRVGIFVEGELLAQGTLTDLSRELFGNTGLETLIKLASIPKSIDHLKSTFASYSAINALDISGEVLRFHTTEDITPKLIRTIIESGEDILSVGKKEYGLDEIYQRYFENGNSKTSKGESRNIKNIQP